MSIVIVDTEYTTWPGALEGGWGEWWQHREIVQVAAIRVGADFVETASLDTLVRPDRNPVLSPLFVELTGISQQDVDNHAVAFDEVLEAFRIFVGGPETPIVCMNGDGSVFRENCALNGIPFPLEQPFHRLWPFLQSVGVADPVSSGDLHRLTDEPLDGHTHNALHDVRSMACWLRHAWRTGIFTSLSQLPTDLPR